MTEEQLEQEMLGWLFDVGYTHIYGPDITVDGDTPERNNYQEVLLVGRLRQAIDRLNPDIPKSAQDDALQQVRDLNTPVLLSANRNFHNLLVKGVPVEYQKDGETRGDFVRLIDFFNPSQNEYVAINQFSIKGEKYSRRPDILLFINGLPLVLIELKNPADETADLNTAFKQIETYKEQIPDIFQYNEMLIISDGSDASMGSLSANLERYMAWRTIDGITIDPLGKFRELETLTRGILPPVNLLDYIRYFILFEDDVTVAKKIAGYHQFYAVRKAIEQVIVSSRTGGGR